MPQLSPLNWILLFVFYWGFLYTLSVILWWNKKNHMFFNIKKSFLVSRKWSWK
uniref:ATP synthase F0 subunit 8 n=1 Tax=Cyclophorus martensianus TaxID=494924 RepID=A0A4P8VVV5_9CAEN|nr:ATP synthase F0 subunit 8 [Cyclophorus martensianus]